MPRQAAPGDGLRPDEKTEYGARRATIGRSRIGTCKNEGG
jgi:hypothetical protein